MNQAQPTVIIPPDVVNVVAARWPQEVVVENSDGTVSLYAGSIHAGRIIRARRAVDVIREDC